MKQWAFSKKLHIWKICDITNEHVLKIIINFLLNEFSYKVNYKVKCYEPDDHFSRFIKFWSSERNTKNII